MLCYVILFYIMLCYVMLCYVFILDNIWGFAPMNYFTKKMSEIYKPKRKQNVIKPFSTYRYSNSIIICGFLRL